MSLYCVPVAGQRRHLFEEDFPLFYIEEVGSQRLKNSLKDTKVAQRRAAMQIEVFPFSCITAGRRNKNVTFL